MAVQTEEKAKPSLWNQALRVVKGDSTHGLVEQFTQEMTLVAEGLCEDQARLRKAVDELRRDADDQHAKGEQDYSDLSCRLEAHQQDTSRQLKELSRRLEALEKAKPAKRESKFFIGGDMLSRLTVLAAIVCGTWLLVTVLNLFI